MSKDQKLINNQNVEIVDKLYFYKGLNCCLKDIFKYAEQNKRSGINIIYIWVNRCDICGSKIQKIDDEYSYDFISYNNICTAEEIKHDMEMYNKDYPIYENMYENENKNFIYMGYNELSNQDIYYYYKLDYTNKELCNICLEVW